MILHGDGAVHGHGSVSANAGMVNDGGAEGRIHSENVRPIAQVHIANGEIAKPCSQVAIVERTVGGRVVAGHCETDHSAIFNQETADAETRAAFFAAAYGKGGAVDGQLSARYRATA